MSGVVVVNQVGSELFDGYGQSVAKQDGYAVSSINSGYLVMGKDSQDLARFIKVGSDGALSVNFSASSIQTDIIKVGGTTIATGNGNSGPGVQRVAISADNDTISVNAAQSGTWTVQPGNTANTTPWLSTISQGGNSAIVSAGGALTVDGSAVTQPISGTITANIGTSGSLALDATLAKLTVSQGAATGTNTQALVGAVATSAAPTYTTGTINPLSLTTSGLLRVDGSGVTQPVSGTVSITANSSVNLNQVAGTTVATGNGVVGTGVQRVAIASNNTAFPVNAVQSGTWTVQPGNTANTTAWLVTDSSNGTVTPGAVATRSSLIGAQFNSTLPTLTTGQQAALQSDSSGRLLIGALPTGSNTIGAVTGTGVSGSPAGGVLTIQGVSGATPVPVTGTLSSSATELATFFGVAPGVSPGNNKSMLSIVNTTGSTVTIKIQEIYLINVQTSGVSGVPILFEMRRIVSHTGGALITTTESADLSDSLDANVTLRTGATIGTESTKLLWRNIWSSDDWQVGSTDMESADHASQSLIPIYAKKNQASKSITLRANQGLTLKCATNTTVGLFDIMVVFTQE
jgi:hypothetical protein